MTQKRKHCDNRFEMAAARAIRSGEMRAIDLARELGIGNSFFARAETDHIAECVLRISIINTPTTAIRLLGHCYQAFNQGRKKGRSHVKNGQHVAGASSAMLQPNPSNEALIICRIILFPSCLRTISGSPGVLERCMQLL